MNQDQLVTGYEEYCSLRHEELARARKVSVFLVFVGFGMVWFISGLVPEDPAPFPNAFWAHAVPAVAVFAFYVFCAWVTKWSVRPEMSLFEYTRDVYWPEEGRYEE